MRELRRRRSRPTTVDIARADQTLSFTSAPCRPVRYPVVESDAGLAVELGPRGPGRGGRGTVRSRRRCGRGPRARLLRDRGEPGRHGGRGGCRDRRAVRHGRCRGRRPRDPDHDDATDHRPTDHRPADHRGPRDRCAGVESGIRPRQRSFRPGWSTVRRRQRARDGDRGRPGVDRHRRRCVGSRARGGRPSDGRCGDALGNRRGCGHPTRAARRGGGR
jgi:hypothetical protein